MKLFYTTVSYMKNFFKKAGCLLSGLMAFAGLIVLGLVLILLFLNPIAHWAIEKYAPEFTGRKIILSEISVRPFSGFVEMKGLVVKEQDGQTDFARAGTTGLRLQPAKLLFSEYHFDSIWFDTLHLNILQNGYAFNFDDMLNTLLAEDTTTHDPADTLKYSVGKVKALEVMLTYNNTLPRVSLVLHDGDVELSGIGWNENVIKIKAAAQVNEAGRLLASMAYDLNNADYSLDLAADEIGTTPLFPYFSDFINSTRADGLFSAKLRINGNADNTSLLAMRGNLRLDDFVLTDAYDEKQIGWKQFSIMIDSINTAGNLYRFDNILISEPYFLLTLMPEGNSLSALMRSSDSPADTPQTLAGIEGTPANVINPFIMLAGLVGDIAEQYSKNEYGMNRFAIENGTIVYNDFLTNEKFSVLFEQFNAQTASFNDSSKSVKFDISTLMNRYGDVKAKLAVDNSNYRDFDLNLNINSLTMSIFNPYTKYYVAHPFWRGDISFTTRTTVKNGALDSRNRLLIKQVKVGDKVKSDSAFNIPVKLAVAILRDRKGNIDLEIPIKGSLNDPDYKWGKAALKVLTNLLVKAVTAPFDLLANAIGGNPEDLKAVVFEPLQDSIGLEQRKSLDAMSKVLTEKPEMMLKLALRFNIGLERDEMAIRTALSRWIAEKNNQKSLVANGSLPADSLRLYSPNDSVFGQWLIQKTQLNSPAISLQDKCIKAIGGKETADQLVEAVNVRREAAVHNYLISKGLTEDRFILVKNTEENLNLNTPLPTYDATFDVK